MAASADSGPVVPPPPAPEPEVTVEPPPVADVASVTDADPHGLGVALGKLMGGSRRTAKAAALSVASEFEADEVVEIAVAGRFRACDAVALLTNRRVILANDRAWDPEIVIIDDVAGLGVEGWAERRSATLRLTDGDDVHVFDRINDTAVAESLAHAIRSR